MKRIEVYKDMLCKFFPSEDTIHNCFIVLYLDELYKIFNLKDKYLIKLELSNYTLKTLSLIPMLGPEYKREISLLTELADVLKLIAQDMGDEFKLKK